MNNQPLVSIILPIRNEAAHIEQTLTCVGTQTYPIDRMEVLVIDGMSDDSTQERMSEFLQNGPFPSMFVIPNARKIFPTGFNLGVKYASGEYCLMLGGHTLIPETYVQRCVESLSNGTYACVGGLLETVSRSFIGNAIACAMASKFGVGNVSFRTGSVESLEVDTVAFGMYKKALFADNGLLDEELVRNQDDEFNYRIRKKGGKILLMADQIIQYQSRSSLSKLWQQYFQYGFWKVRVLQKHPRQMQWRQFIPAAFVSALLGSIICLLYSISWPLVMVAGSYIIANVIASLHVSYRKGLKYLPVLPLVFAILHISYGLGFLAGLFRFIHRWGDKVGRVPPFEPVGVQ